MEQVHNPGQRGLLKSFEINPPNSLNLHCCIGDCSCWQNIDKAFEFRVEKILEVVLFDIERKAINLKVLNV